MIEVAALYLFAPNILLYEVPLYAKMYHAGLYWVNKKTFKIKGK